MGRGAWDSEYSWANTRSSIYMDADLNPSNIKIRESRDSDANPASTALIVGLDVTGSMTRVWDARTGLGTLVGQIYERKPISDPHIMIMGIGDFEYDRAPLQVTQFEAQNDPLITQMEKIFLECGGGGNNHESYAAAWLFAAMRTSIDCFEKRRKKGYLFTVGDEDPTPVLRREHIHNFLGMDLDRDIEGERALEMAQVSYQVFHVCVEGDYYLSRPDQTLQAWRRLLGQNVLPLTDHTKLAEVIVSAIQVAEGAGRDDVVKSWNGDTSMAIHDVVQAELAGGEGRLLL